MKIPINILNIYLIYKILLTPQGSNPDSYGPKPYVLPVTPGVNYSCGGCGGRTHAPVSRPTGLANQPLHQLG